MWGITMRAAGETGRYWQLVDEASKFETSPSMRQLGYPAHITFAAYDEIDPLLLVSALGVFDDEGPITLRFDEIATFDAQPLVLWLKPVAEPRLFGLHRKLQKVLGEEGCDLHYRSSNWIPHCTLAMAVAHEKREAALAFARTPIAPVQLTFDVADAISWPPPLPIASRPLHFA